MPWDPLLSPSSVPFHASTHIGPTVAHVGTPHLGYAEQGSYEALYTLAVDQLLAFAEGQPINVVHPEAVRESHP